MRSTKQNWIRKLLQNTNNTKINHLLFEVLKVKFLFTCLYNEKLGNFLWFSSFFSKLLLSGKLYELIEKYFCFMMFAKNISFHLLTMFKIISLKILLALHKK